ETVWRQADRHRVPRLAFANKMDRTGASWDLVLGELHTTLGATALPVQLPVFEGMTFCGAIDLVTMETLIWNTAMPGGSGDQKVRSGSEFCREPLTGTHPEYARAVAGRDALVQRLAELDDEMMEAFLEAEDAATDGQPAAVAIPADTLRSALRRVTLGNRGVPVLCGSSLRNIGVQPLMDAVIDYLPSPLDRPAPIGTLPNGTTVRVGASADSGALVSTEASQGDLCALAFKVISDIQRGPMVFVRVYSGVLEGRAVLLNVTNNTKERVSRLFQMYGDQAEPLPRITAGNIGVLLGLKHTRTGDTLTLEQTHRRQRGGSPQLEGVALPPPVFFCAIEPESSADEKPLQEALACLLLEDPSLRVSQDVESGQTLLSGQGELHLEVVGDRLRRDFRVRADMGKVRISYRETAGQPATTVLVYDREVLGKRGRATMSVTVLPLPADEVTGRPMLPEIEDDMAEAPLVVNADGNAVTVDLADLTSADAAAPISAADASSGRTLTPDVIAGAVRDGVEAALARGPLLGFPVTHALVRVHGVCLFGADTTAAALRACASQAVGEVLARSQPTLLEPAMRVQIRVPEQHVGTVLGDLGGSARRGRILAMDDDSDGAGDQERQADATVSQRRLLHARVPLAGMLGYASALRSLTAGTGTFTMELHGYGTLSPTQQQAVLKEMRGY
ncbi:hypothetical protein THASP1DRAFT_20864, partial [Thamnocephalis sphaerospora]